jgi:hypothetical protein
MRRIGFYITDFAWEPGGFTVSDFDELLQRGVTSSSSVGCSRLPTTSSKLHRGLYAFRGSVGVSSVIGDYRVVINPTSSAPSTEAWSGRRLN